MGLFAAGVGRYNFNTSQAAINADTAMRPNEYLYEAQWVHNQRDDRHLAPTRPIPPAPQFKPAGQP